MKKLVYLFFILILHGNVFCHDFDKLNNATKLVVGKITNNYGEPLPGVKIKINETGETFFSDFEGNYSIRLKSTQSHVISIMALGYLPLQLKSTGLVLFSNVSLTSL